MVDLYVGLENSHYLVHKAYLCARIPYFDKMFNGGFSEASDNSAAFPEDDPRSFDLLIEWVYTGTVRHLHCYDNKGYSAVTWDAFLLYKLADKLCINTLMDQVMNAYILFNKTTGGIPSIECMGVAYDSSPQGSRLRKYICWALHFAMTELHTDVEKQRWKVDEVIRVFKNNEDLAIDFFKALQDQEPSVRVKDPREVPPCTFHHHAEGEECPDARK